MSQQNPEDNNNAKRDDEIPLKNKIRAVRKRTREDLWKDLRGLMYPNWKHMGEDDKETLETSFEVNYFIALGTNKSIPSTATSTSNGTNINIGEASTSGSTNNASTSSEAATSSNTEGVDFDSGTSSSGIGSGSNSDSIHNSGDIHETSDAKRSRSEEVTSGTDGSNESIPNTGTSSPNTASSSTGGDVDTNAPSTSVGLRSSGSDFSSSSALSARPSTSSIDAQGLFRFPPLDHPVHKPHRPFQGGVLTSIANLANSYHYTRNDLPSFSGGHGEGSFDPQPSTSRSNPPLLPRIPIPTMRSFTFPCNNDDEDNNNNTGEIDPIQFAIAQSFKF